MAVGAVQVVLMRQNKKRDLFQRGQLEMSGWYVMEEVSMFNSIFSWEVFTPTQAYNCSTENGTTPFTARNMWISKSSFDYVEWNNECNLRNATTFLYQIIIFDVNIWWCLRRFWYVISLSWNFGTAFSVAWSRLSKTNWRGPSYAPCNCQSWYRVCVHVLS